MSKGWQHNVHFTPQHYQIASLSPITCIFKTFTTLKVKMAQITSKPNDMFPIIIISHSLNVVVSTNHMKLHDGFFLPFEMIAVSFV